jgi:hypothetical protein
MHNLLEDYLAEVKAKLSALPVKRREEEMREMRQHLLNSVIVNRDFGQSEEESEANAVAEFGPPQESAASLVRAWRQGEQKKNARHFWRMSAVSIGFFVIEGFLRPHVIVSMIPMMAYALVMMARRSLAPQTPQAWWTYQCLPISLTQCWVETAWLGVGCLVYFFTVPHVFTQVPLLTVVFVVGLCLAWAKWLWVQWHRGDPIEPLPE